MAGIDKLKGAMSTVDKDEEKLEALERALSDEAPNFICTVSQTPNGKVSLNSYTLDPKGLSTSSTLEMKPRAAIDLGVELARIGLLMLPKDRS